jgi:hypothetical protein
MMLRAMNTIQGVVAMKWTTVDGEGKRKNGEKSVTILVVGRSLISTAHTLSVSSSFIFRRSSPTLRLTL